MCKPTTAKVSSTTTKEKEDGFKLPPPKLSLSQFFDLNQPWVLVPNGSFMGFFDNVPQVAWEFYIGGYQPAQKWLKDRKDRKLEFDDILHYQKIIVALSETDRLMQEIEKIEIESF